MIPKPIATGIVFSSIVFATASTQAQVVVDVSKITCDQFVHGKIGATRPVGLWLSGFYNGLRNNTSFDLKAFEANLSKVEQFCYEEKNFTVPVMQAIERIFGQAK